jgi:hypothetical protein
MNYKRYSIENNKIVYEILNKIIDEIIEKEISKNIETVEIRENHFNYEEKELNEDFVSTGYFNYFLNLGNYLNSISHN